MSTSVSPKLTTVGLAALINADSDGVEAVIAEMAFGDQSYTPTVDATALQNEITRVPIIAGKRVTDTQFQVHSIVSPTAFPWTVKEVGFFLETGELFAIWSDDSPLHRVNYYIDVNDNTGTVEVEELHSFEVGEYLLRCITINDGINPATFSVKAPSGLIIRVVPADLLTVMGPFTFIINSGSVPWVLGDEIGIRIWDHTPLFDVSIVGDVHVYFDVIVAELPLDNVTVHQDVVVVCDCDGGEDCCDELLDRIIQIEIVQANIQIDIVNIFNRIIIIDTDITDIKILIEELRYDLQKTFMHLLTAQLKLAQNNVTIVNSVINLRNVVCCLCEKLEG